MKEKLEKRLEEIKAMNWFELRELKEAILAYDLGLSGEEKEMTDEEYTALDAAMDNYYNSDEIPYFVNEQLMDSYYVNLSSKEKD